ncbi:MAG: hypothetical protein WB760_28445, partial [Xanthobacteraceae bacterium]
APWRRSVNYIVDHICEPICPSWFASCRSNRPLQGAGGRPLTMDQTPAWILYLALRDFVEVLEKASGQQLIVSQGIVDALAQIKQKMTGELEEAKKNPQIQPVTPS